MDERGEQADVIAHLRAEIARSRAEVAKLEADERANGFFRSMSDEGKVILGIILLAQLPMIIYLIAAAFGVDLD